ncbi:MAG TPA: hemerythrin domain-containing protein [Burkholderiaceae bacterium]|nr:hemerythrin domain-containing protein [Burkholderiaceae bacterium]
MNKSDIPARQRAALGMLIDDHRKVAKLVDEYESETRKTNQKEIIDQVGTALLAHTEIEEKLFYPWLREKDADTFDDMLDEAIVEHASIKDIVADLRKMEPGDDLYDAKVTVISEFVEHHVKEEEDEMFKAVIDNNIDLNGLDKKMTEMKDTFLSDMGG